jgi:thiol-disulfide isomerase/thioredoxin
MKLSTVPNVYSPMTRKLHLIFALLLAVPTLLAAEEAATPKTKLLTVGDPAPAIKVAKWLQGEPVKSFEKGKVYVVEFWASWCGPCKVTIPHLNELHLKYKDRVTIIGVAIREDDPADPVKTLRQMGKKMTYRVALDDTSEGDSGVMDKTWMKAADLDGIPYAFIIKDSQIAWIGSPFSLKEPLLDEVLSGTFDIKVAAEKYQRKRENAPKLQSLEADFDKALEEEKWDEAEKILTDRRKLSEDDDMPSLMLSELDLRLQKQDTAAAEKLANDLSTQNSKNYMFHNGLAWSLATAKTLTPRMLDIASKSAALANDLQENKDPDVLETVARLQFLKGDKPGAIATQEKAVNLAEPKSRLKVRLEKALDAYRHGELPKSE